MKENKKINRKLERGDKLRGFHKFLLNLHIFRDILKDESENMLLDALETDQLLSVVNLKRKSEIVEAVPLRFSSVEHYNKLWESLFFEEAKSQIYRQIAENKKVIIEAEFASLGETDVEEEKIMHFNSGKSKNIEGLVAGNLVVLSPVEVHIFLLSQNKKKTTLI